ncbi:hypothetical protein [Streptomyces sp. NPDC093707]|uniref:hypothetical protein n=1 Tax=Streptomyces sp. NPDC093707 TaxID=3154984 RepID=UPI00344BE3DC
MHDSVSTGRSAATGRGRMLWLLALLTLLFTALTSAYSDATPPAAAKCPLAAESSAAPSPADRACDASADVLGSAGGETRHPGNGFRRLCHGSACHLRPQAPTGPNGKAVRETPVMVSAAAPGHAAPWAVLPAADAGTPARVTVLRC